MFFCLDCADDRLETQHTSRPPSFQEIPDEYIHWFFNGNLKKKNDSTAAELSIDIFGVRIEDLLVSFFLSSPISKEDIF